MKNPIKKFFDNIAEENVKRMNRKMEDEMAHSIYVSNDPKDEENGVYVYVHGVPIMRVAKNNDLSENTISIESVGGYIKNIKDMYRNKNMSNSAR